MEFQRFERIRFGSNVLPLLISGYFVTKCTAHTCLILIETSPYTIKWDTEYILNIVSDPSLKLLLKQYLPIIWMNDNVEKYNGVAEHIVI